MTRTVSRRRVATALVLVGLVGAAVALLVALGADRSHENEPYTYSRAREAELRTRAAAGLAHVLFVKSPGGVVASAARTARWRPLVDQAAAPAGIDPDLLEALVLLESAGRPDAVAGPGLEGAVGLAQILAGTARDLLGMHVDLAAARRLSDGIARADRRGRTLRAQRLRLRLRRVDERFDPRKALAGAVRYLKLARERFGRDDLAVASYHMGIGNLETVLRAFGKQEPSYTRLYFDSTPTSHAPAYRLLSRFGDDSATYYWRVLAAEQIMRLYRRDPLALERLARLQTAKGSAEEVLHPRQRTEVFDSPTALAAAWRAGRLRPFPDQPARLGLRLDPRMGRLAGRLRRRPSLYRGLRPEALALAIRLARMVREASGERSVLAVTSTVRDRAYQRLLIGVNPEATHHYSLHTTGYAFDVLRRYHDGREAQAFQFALDRLQALDLIAWVREPEVIHITVSGDAGKRALGPRADLPLG